MVAAAAAALALGCSVANAQAIPTPVTTPGVNGSFEGPFYGPVPSGDPNSIEDYIVFYIGSAQKTVDIANYTWSSQKIITALITAYQNGIKVRVVADSSETNSAPYTGQLTTAGVPMVQRAGGPDGIMHCKYIVVDNMYVWLGSANMTTGSSKDNCENGMAIGSLDLAADFENDFNRMFTQQLWSINKTSMSPTPTVTLYDENNNPVLADVYFSGEDANQEYSVLQGLVNNAQSSVQVIAYELHGGTQGGAGALVDALVSAYQRGINVQVLLDDDSSTQQKLNLPTFTELQAANVPVSWYHPPSGLMHDKVIIIDGATVEFGSFNYTDAAAVSQGNGNDEDFLVLHYPYMADVYQQEFSVIWQTAGAPGQAVVGNGLSSQPTTTTTPPTTTTTTTPTTGTSTGTSTGTATVPTTPLTRGSTPILRSGQTTPGSTAASSSPSSGSSGSSGGSGCEISRTPRAPGSLAPLALLTFALLILRRRRRAR